MNSYSPLNIGSAESFLQLNKKILKIKLIATSSTVHHYQVIKDSKNEKQTKNIKEIRIN